MTSNENTNAPNSHLCEIQWDALKAAFENHSGGAKSLLDCNSGEVLDVTGSAPTQPDNKTRYLSIVPVPSRTQYQMMETFIASITTTELKVLLHETIVGKGAFRRFKDALSQFPEERKRWFTFRDALLHQYILDWLHENNVQFRTAPPWNLELPASSAPLPAPTLVASTNGINPLKSVVSDQELKSFVLDWAKQHGAEFGYNYGPGVFEALCNDLKKSFSFSKRV